MPARSAAERTRIGKIGAHTLHSQVADPVAHTAPARRAFNVDRFEKQVDPAGVLDPAERARRAEHAKRAYMLKLAQASVKARANKRAGSTTAGQSRHSA
jgi:hypothetical protein